MKTIDIFQMLIPVLVAVISSSFVYFQVIKNNKVKLKELEVLHKNDLEKMQKELELSHKNQIEKLQKELELQSNYMKII
ncbi:hypothetical protein [Lysinibacillus fusiformis]|uniref:hypothetical protein n=1 Tax=Lysinibacillus fusiformis TaxID=28031 RepID=UPI0023A9D181|nr:hypothetical protein [Lysinibacillus fusiformis]WEA41637.1 hypothetical protein PWJ66_23145 [Lysinibacillus fusiformis]